MTSFPNLSSREKDILQSIIQSFIITANPVPSKEIALKKHNSISSATIRNTMNILEKKGYLQQMHSSSGRIPTDLGYRYYVDSLMRKPRLTKKEEQAITDWEETLARNTSDSILTASRLLSKLSNLLAIVIAPTYSSSIFRKIELIDIGSNRLLVVLTIESGLIKTITVEIENVISENDLSEISTILNERFSGLLLAEISTNIREVLSDINSSDKTGLIRIFIDSAEDIFEDEKIQRFYFGGVEYMAMQPEFSDLRDYKGIVELIENEDLIIHLFDNVMENNRDDVHIRIGNEHQIKQIAQCSIVSSTYQKGKAKGTIGLVGPTRMNYPKMAALVKQMSTRLNNKL